MELLKRTGGWIWEFVESISFGLGIFVVIYVGLAQPSAVMGSSSYPTIKPGEKFITEKVSYRFHPPKRGDFVILQSPRNSEVDFIKRVIGLPGEHLKISDGNVFIDGNLLDESDYLDSSVHTGPEAYLSENEEILIPNDHFFVMGDNRAHSSDSRDFGPVSSSAIVGHVVLRFWPVDQIGTVH